jgi:hypothetical protein
MTAQMPKRKQVSQAVLLYNVLQILTAETGHGKSWDPLMFASKILNAAHVALQLI